MLYDAGIITQEDFRTLLELRDIGHEWLAAARSRAGETWEVTRPFDVLVDRNGNGSVFPLGYVSWGFNERDVHRFNPGDLLLVVGDTAFAGVHRLLSLDSGLTFTMADWQVHCVLIAEAA